MPCPGSREGAYAAPMNRLTRAPIESARSTRAVRSPHGAVDPMALAASQAKSNAARLSVLSNASLVALKLGVGLWIGSVAVVSEAIHSGIDLLAALVAWYAVRMADAPPDHDHPYGHGKVESISGTVEALLIFLAGAWIVVEAARGIVRGTKSESVGWGVAVMGLSAAVNVFVSRHLLRIAKEHDSVALEADAHHLSVDVYASVGVFVGLGLVALTGWHVLDPLVAIGVGLLIVHTAYDITKRAFAPLLDATLPAEEVDAIEAALKRDPRVRGYHHLRTRKAGAVRFVGLPPPARRRADPRRVAPHLARGEGPRAEGPPRRGGRDPRRAVRGGAPGQGRGDHPAPLRCGPCGVRRFIAAWVRSFSSASYAAMRTTRR